MAVKPRDLPITREQVSEWLTGYKRAKNLPSFNTGLREHLAKKIADLKLDDTMVDTSGHEDRAAITPVLDMILDDLESYGYSE